MSVLLVIGGTIFWFGMVFFGIRHQLQSGESLPALLQKLTHLPRAVLYLIAGLSLLLSARFVFAFAKRLAEFHGVLGPNVLGAILCAIIAALALAVALRSDPF